MSCETLEDLARVCGFQPTLELCRAYGSRTIHVPLVIPETHPIALTMGYRAACALAANYGGGMLCVPAERTALMDVRNARMVHDYVELQHSVSKLAEVYGMSRKRVIDILDKAGVKRRSIGA